MYFLLVATLIQSIRTTTWGRSLHFTDEGRDYFNIIKMTREYSPLNERPLRQALQTFKLTGAYTRLMQTDHITPASATPLSIAESKRDERLMKLVLEETGNLFCKKDIDGNQYSVEMAHQLALHECGMGLRISKNNFDKTSFYGSQLTEILQHNTPEAKMLIGQLIKVIDNEKFIQSHPMFDDYLISKAFRDDNVVLMDLILHMHSFRGVLFEAKMNETPSLMQFAIRGEKHKLLQYFLRFVRSKYDVQFIQSISSQFRFSEAFGKSVGKLEFAFSANDSRYIIPLVNRSPKNFALRLALIHAQIDNHAESAAIDELLHLIEITKIYPFYAKALQSLKLVLGQFTKILEGTPDELLIVKVLQEKHPLVQDNLPMSGQSFEYNELIDKFFYLKLNRYIDLKSHISLSQSFIPRTTLEYHMMKDINLALTNEYQHYLNSHDVRHLANLITLIRKMPNHKIYYLHHEIAIIYYELMRQSNDALLRLEYYRNATWFDPGISTEFRYDRQYQAEFDPIERAVLVAHPDLLIAKINYLREHGFKHLFSVYELECKISLLSQLTILLFETPRSSTHLKEQITGKLDYIVHVIEFLHKYNYYSELTKQSVLMDVAAKLKSTRESKVVLMDSKSYTLTELDAVLSLHRPQSTDALIFDSFMLTRLIYTVSFLLGCRLGLSWIQNYIADHPDILLLGNTTIVHPPLPAPIPKTVIIKPPLTPQTATQVPVHSYLGQLRSVKFNHKQGEQHRVSVELPMIVDATMYPPVDGFMPVDEIVTQGMIQFALAEAKRQAPKIEVELVEKDALMILSIDNRHAVFNYQYNQFMKIFQQKLIEHSPRYKAACARKVLLDEILNVQRVHVKSIENNKEFFNSERQDDILRLVVSLNQLISKANAHQIRSVARTTLKALETFDGLQKIHHVAPQIPYGLSHRTTSELQKLSLHLLPKCHDYSHWVRSLKSAWDDVVESVNQCKIIAKQFREEFIFDWVKKPNLITVAPSIQSNDIDSGSDEEILDIAVPNNDDDNDTNIIETQPSAPKFEPRELTDEEITRIAAPVSWCTAVLPGKKQVATSSTKFLPERKVDAQDRIHIENASELCTMISEIARPLIAINSPARRRLVVYQLIDLFAQLNLECEFLAPRNYIRRAFQQDILSIRDLLRHFSAFYLQADFDDRSNQLLHQFTRDLLLLFKQARSEDSTKQANIAIFAKHALSEHRELDEYLAALQEDLAFLKGQTAQQSLNTLVDQGHIHLYLGYLSQIGNIVHEIIQDESLRQPFFSIRGQGKLLSISEWMTEFENTDLIAAPLPLRQIFYFCLQVRNIRGHELQDVSTHFVLGLIRRVMIDVDELQNYVNEFHDVFLALKHAPMQPKPNS